MLPAEQQVKRQTHRHGAQQRERDVRVRKREVDLQRKSRRSREVPEVQVVKTDDIREALGKRFRESGIYHDDYVLERLAGLVNEHGISSEILRDAVRDLEVQISLEAKTESDYAHAENMTQSGWLYRFTAGAMKELGRDLGVNDISFSAFGKSRHFGDVAKKKAEIRQRTSYMNTALESAITRAIDRKRLEDYMEMGGKKLRRIITEFQAGEISVAQVLAHTEYTNGIQQIIGHINIHGNNEYDLGGSFGILDFTTPEMKSGNKAFKIKNAIHKHWAVLLRDQLVNLAAETAQATVTSKVIEKEVDRDYPAALQLVIDGGKRIVTSGTAWTVGIRGGAKFTIGVTAGVGALTGGTGLIIAAGLGTVAGFARAVMNSRKRKRRKRLDAAIGSREYTVKVGKEEYEVVRSAERIVQVLDAQVMAVKKAEQEVKNAEQKWRAARSQEAKARKKGEAPPLGVHSVNDEIELRERKNELHDTVLVLYGTISDAHGRMRRSRKSGEQDYIGFGYQNRDAAILQFAQQLEGALSEVTAFMDTLEDESRKQLQDAMIREDQKRKKLIEKVESKFKGQLRKGELTQILKGTLLGGAAASAVSLVLDAAFPHTEPVSAPPAWPEGAAPAMIDIGGDRIATLSASGTEIIISDTTDGMVQDAIIPVPEGVDIRTVGIEATPDGSRIDFISATGETVNHIDITEYGVPLGEALIETTNTVSVVDGSAQPFQIGEDTFSITIDANTGMVTILNPADGTPIFTASESLFSESLFDLPPGALNHASQLSVYTYNDSIGLNSAINNDRLAEIFFRGGEVTMQLADTLAVEDIMHNVSELAGEVSEGTNTELRQAVVSTFLEEELTPYNMENLQTRRTPRSPEMYVPDSIKGRDFSHPEVTAAEEEHTGDRPAGMLLELRQRHARLHAAEQSVTERVKDVMTTVNTNGDIGVDFLESATTLRRDLRTIVTQVIEARQWYEGGEGDLFYQDIDADQYDGAFEPFLNGVESTVAPYPDQLDTAVVTGLQNYLSTDATSPGPLVDVVSQLMIDRGNDLSVSTLQSNIRGLRTSLIDMQHGFNDFIAVEPGNAIIDGARADIMQKFTNVTELFRLAELVVRFDLAFPNVKVREYIMERLRHHGAVTDASVDYPLPFAFTSDAGLAAMERLVRSIEVLPGEDKHAAVSGPPASFLTTGLVPRINNARIRQVVANAVAGYDIFDTTTSVPTAAVSTPKTPAKPAAPKAPAPKVVIKPSASSSAVGLSGLGGGPVAPLSFGTPVASPTFGTPSAPTSPPDFSAPPSGPASPPDFSTPATPEQVSAEAPPVVPEADPRQSLPEGYREAFDRIVDQLERGSIIMFPFNNEEDRAVWPQVRLWAEQNGKLDVLRTGVQKMVKDNLSNGINTTRAWRVVGMGDFVADIVVPDSDKLEQRQKAIFATNVRGSYERGGILSPISSREVAVFSEFYRELESAGELPELRRRIWAAISDDAGEVLYFKRVLEIPHEWFTEAPPAEDFPFAQPEELESTGAPELTEEVARRLQELQEEFLTSEDTDALLKAIQVGNTYDAFLGPDSEQEEALTAFIDWAKAEGHYDRLRDRVRRRIVGQRDIGIREDVAWRQSEFSSVLSELGPISMDQLGQNRERFMFAMWDQEIADGEQLYRPEHIDDVDHFRTYIEQRAAADDTAVRDALAMVWAGWSEHTRGAIKSAIPDTWLQIIDPDRFPSAAPETAPEEIAEDDPLAGAWDPDDFT